METVIEEDTDDEEDHDYAAKRPYVGVIVGDGDDSSISSLDIQEIVSQDNSKYDVCYQENVLLFDEMKQFEGDQESKMDDSIVVENMTRNQRNDYKNAQSQRNERSIDRRENTVVATPFSQQQLEGERTELPGQEGTKETRNDSKEKQGLMAPENTTNLMNNKDSAQPMNATAFRRSVEQTLRQSEGQDQIQKRRDLLRATFFNRSHPNNTGCRNLFL